VSRAQWSGPAFRAALRARVAAVGRTLLALMPVWRCDECRRVRLVRAVLILGRAVFPLCAGCTPAVRDVFRRAVDVERS
jgi:hypothetical protein